MCNVHLPFSTILKKGCKLSVAYLKQSAVLLISPVDCQPSQGEGEAGNTVEDPSD